MAGTRRPTPEFGPSDFVPTFQVFGKKHALVILWTLFRRSPLGFGELRKIVGVNPATLTARLKVLEKEGFVERRALNVIPRRVEYALTPMARAMSGVWRELLTWRVKFPASSRRKAPRAHP